ncbi:MAG: ParA family protein [Prevotellaceae bacterium]|jgi:chromosome partitioning protein|nr:ParA family protein [Prevotellaceae bacterium]
MKIVSVHSLKGGTGKTTLVSLIVSALVAAGYRCLIIDTDASNNSLSYFFSDNEPESLEQMKTVFHLFMGEKADNCVIHINPNLDLIHGDVRLNEFRSADSLKKLKRILKDLDYDFCIIDTSPTYDNIIGNVLTASDVLLVPIQQDVFSYQALQYQFDKIADLELENLDVQVVFNGFENPMNDNKGTYRNQVTNMFLEDENLKPYINPNRISKSSFYRKYINLDNYRIEDKGGTQKCFGEVKALVNAILGIEIKEGF